MHQLLAIWTLQLKHDRVPLYLRWLNKRLVRSFPFHSILGRRPQWTPNCIRNDRYVRSNAAVLLVVPPMV